MFRICQFRFAEDLDKRRSMTGYIFSLVQAPISWRSILQSTIVLFTTETEYMPMIEAMKEAFGSKVA